MLHRDVDTSQRPSNLNLQSTLSTTVPMSLGYSISDVLAVCALLSKAIGALSESSGSCSHYDELMSALYSYHRSVLEVEQICTLPVSQFHSATKNAIAHEVSLSRTPLEAFLARIDSYRGRIHKSSWRKIGWALLKEEEVPKLRSVLAMHTGHLNLLISTAGTKASLRTEVRQEEDRSILNNQTAELENLRKEVARSNEALQRLQTSVSFRNIGQSWEWSGEAPIRFEDALGRRILLPPQLVEKWDVFEAILHIRFHDFPGQQRVESGNYEIRDEADASRSIAKAEWAKLILPGMGISMNMVLKRQIDGDEAYRCPRSDCNFLNERPEGVDGVNCKRCGLWIHAIEGNRVEEVEDENQEEDMEGLPLEDDDVRHFKRISLINHQVKQMRQSAPESSSKNMGGYDNLSGTDKIWYCPMCNFGPLNPYRDAACRSCGWYPNQS
ncbi:hypothetical protein BDD12DRAFT_828233 [Trichophaea hybrida]|nr:hypothetical protein BDD12DRAFT_828233 [Trichophaea hybrida]